MGNYIPQAEIQSDSESDDTLVDKYRYAIIVPGGVIRFGLTESGDIKYHDRYRASYLLKKNWILGGDYLESCTVRKNGLFWWFEIDISDPHDGVPQYYVWDTYNEATEDIYRIENMMSFDE
jgi:hypothetical protein